MSRRLAHLIVVSSLLVAAPLACSSGSSGGGALDAGGTGGIAGGSDGSAGGAQDAGADSGCGPEKALCDGECVDITSHPLHCGGCGVACPLGDVCEASQCKTILDCTQTPCSGFTYCDLASKKCLPGCVGNEQCGSNQACNPATHQCDCVAGHHVCTGACVPDDAPASCGSSCAPCPTDPNGAPTCVAGGCGLACNTGFHACNGACVPNDSTTACGASCTPCPTVANGQATCNGQCGIACNAGYNACGGQCVANSAQSCGPSCSVCPAKAGTKPGCVANHCVSECLNGSKFLTPTLLFVGPNIAALVAGDFTGDGKADIAFGEEYGLKVYDGNGNGTFAPPKDHPLLQDVTDIQLGDFDGNGKNDLIAAVGDNASRTTYVRLAGTTTLVKTTMYQSKVIAVGDFNSDGKDDVASDFHVWLGNGTGGFTVKGYITGIQNAPDQLAAADFTGDGRDDVVLSAWEGIYVVPSNPDGTVGTAILTPLTNGYTRGLGIGDLNGDGKMDVVTNDPTGLVVLLGAGNGLFQATAHYDENFTWGAQALAVADLNGDGRVDVAYPGNLDLTKYVRSRASTATGSLGALTSTVLATQTAVTPVVRDVVSADFDSDGLGDVVVNYAGVRVLLGACN